MKGEMGSRPRDDVGQGVVDSATLLTFYRNTFYALIMTK